MSYSSTVTSENQTTIPKAIIDALRIKPNAKLIFELEKDGSVRLTASSPKTETFASLAGKFGKNYTGVVATAEMMREAAEEGAVARYLKSCE